MWNRSNNGANALTGEQGTTWKRGLRAWFARVTHELTMFVSSLLLAIDHYEAPHDDAPQYETPQSETTGDDDQVQNDDDRDYVGDDDGEVSKPNQSNRHVCDDTTWWLTWYAGLFQCCITGR